MRVAVWPADESGCGYYRLIWPALALGDQHADIDLRLPDQGSGIEGVFTRDDLDVERLVDIKNPPEADIVVMQRPLSAWRADAVEVLQRHGVRVVVDIDDCFETIHPRNVSYRAVDPARSPGMNRLHLMRACQRADLVTVTTPVLARRYGSHGRVAVVPNMVPAWYLGLPRPQVDLCVGWTGSIDTHPTDLQVCAAAVDMALDGGTLFEKAEVRVPFHVVGTGRGVQQALGLARPPTTSGWLPIEEYPHAMARIGVGIVPLDDIAFNHAKSALKLMEFSALGVPTVASPTRDNIRMFREGCGVIAREPKDWLRHLRRLLSDEQHRADVAGLSREVMARFTIEGNADRWWDAWVSCLDRKEAAA